MYYQEGTAHESRKKEKHITSESYQLIMLPEDFFLIISFFEDKLIKQEIQTQQPQTQTL